MDPIFIPIILFSTGGVSMGIKYALKKLDTSYFWMMNRKRNSDFDLLIDEDEPDELRFSSINPSGMKIDVKY